jgi:hypothetical protein
VFRDSGRRKIRFLVKREFSRLAQALRSRRYDASLNAIEGRIAAALEHAAPHTSAEIYLLRVGGPQNAKIRDGILDVKRLQQVDANGLELWEPVLKLNSRSGKTMLLRLFWNGSCHFPDLAEKPTRSINSLIN